MDKGIKEIYDRVMASNLAKYVTLLEDDGGDSHNPKNEKIGINIFFWEDCVSAYALDENLEMDWKATDELLAHPVWEGVDWED